MPILRFVGGRLLAGVVVLVIVTFGSFMAMATLPGDAASAVLGRGASEERLAEFRSEHGLDKGPIAQYGDWAIHAVQGDFGESISGSEPVMELIGPRLRNSLILGFIAGAITLALGIVVGTYAGTHIDGAFDHGSGVISVALMALPEFALGTLLAYLLGVRFDLFPPVALFPLEEGPFARPSTLVLPVMTLVLLNLGYIARLVRSNIAEAMQSPVVTQSRLNGESEHYIRWRVALPAAVPPTLQAAGLMFVYLIGGLVVVEAVFQYQGIGILGIGAALSRDFPLVQGLTVVTTVSYVLIMTMVELAVTLTTPRLRTAL